MTVQADAVLLQRGGDGKARRSGADDEGFERHGCTL